MKEEIKNNYSDVLLYILYFSENGIRSITRLNKILYILKYETNIVIECEFDDTLFGKSSAEIFDMVTSLAEAGIVNIEEVKPKCFTEIADERSVLAETDECVSDIQCKVYTLTDDGKKLAKTLSEKFGFVDLIDIQDCVLMFENMPIHKVLKYARTVEGVQNDYCQ